MTAFLRDIRQSVRSLIRAPGFTAVALATIALGVGANTAMYSVIEGVLLDPLPYPEADRIVALAQVDRETGALDGVSIANFMDWRERTRSFESMALMEPHGVDFMSADGPVALDTWRITEGFFEVMGVPAMLGRLPGPDDYDSGGLVAVVGYGVWRSQFGGDPAVVGRTLPSGAGDLEIIGVMPPEFDYPPYRQVWTPVRYSAQGAAGQRASAYLNGVALLAAGVTPAQAAAELRTVMAGLAEEYPAANGRYTATAMRLSEQLVGQVRPALLILLGAVGLLLLLAAANVANLMLARAADRSRDAAVRGALGASRGRLLQHAFAENLTLGLAGGALGVLVAFWGVEAILAFAPAELPRIEDVSVDGTVLGFAAGVSALMVVLFGLAPALRLSLPDLRGSMADAGDRGASASRRVRRLRNGLVAAQVALAVVLLTAAGLVTRSFVTLVNVDRGYETGSVIATTVQAWAYFQGEPRITFVRDAVDRLGALPGVTAAGATSALPLSEPIGNEHASYEVVGRPVAEGSRPVAHAASVDAGYFEALGIDLRAGRMFDGRDGASAGPVVLVNETLARRHWPSEDPIGQRLRISYWGPEREAEVVGVVADVRTGTLEEPPPATLYIPHPQAPTAGLTFVVRTSTPPGASMAAVRETLWQLHSQMPIEEQTTLETLMRDSLRERRFHLFLLGSFSAAALLLAGIGIYGVISYTMRRRTREIGIRMALGAGSAEIIRWVLGHGALVIAGGLAVGLVATVPLSRTIESLLYGVEPLDPVTLIGVTTLLGSIGLLAMLLPARAATRVDPTESIRVE